MTNLENPDRKPRDAPPAERRGLTRLVRKAGLAFAVYALAILGVIAVAALTQLVSAAVAAPVDGRSAPTCAEGPAREGDAILGTPCDDHIVVPASVVSVNGGAGDDVIVEAQSGPAAVSDAVACVPPHCGAGSQEFNGGPGEDIVYGDRGNDILRGGEGNDRLYGGIGDDRVEGNAGNDWLSGGFGGDVIDGGEGDDYVRGDATIDKIFDTGGGFDTLSFSTGVTPGFGGNIAKEFETETGISGIPDGAEGERGVVVNLGAGGEKNTNNGEAGSGGGVDTVQPSAFERVIGTPFADLITGTEASEELLGGGGADVIRGGGGVDTLGGGADGDYLEAAAGSTVDGEAGPDNCVGGNQANCEGTKSAVVPRVGEANAVSVGEITSPAGSTQIYVVGGTATGETITANYDGSFVQIVVAGATFDGSAEDAGGCTVAAGGTEALCNFAATSGPAVPPLDSILIAGMGGDDTIAANGFPDGTSVIELGGAGADTVSGGASEDTLVDGPGEGADGLFGGPGDDALVHNGGPDNLESGEGSDLFLSVSICDNETLNGGPSLAGDRDNASWAKLKGAVSAQLSLGLVGEVGGEGQPFCGTGAADHLVGIEDLEGSESSDVLVGDEGPNQLLGHKGADTYSSLGGEDLILANSGSKDTAINCGAAIDHAVIDLAAIGDPRPVECEYVREGNVEEFIEEIQQPLPAPIVPAAPPPDVTPPQTKIAKRPKKVVLTRRATARISFRFAAEPGARFRCRLDRAKYKPCSSPRSYRVRTGPHTFRVFAIDAAGNRDASPALFAFRVKRLRPR